MRNLVLLPFLAFAVGVPVNALASFAALLVGVLVVLFAAPRSPRARLVAAACLLTIGAACMILAPPAIEEGMNAFVPNNPHDAALRRDLPAAVYDRGLQLFNATYPADRLRNRPRNLRACWPDIKIRAISEYFCHAYAFSADGIWSGAKYSRRTDSVDFHTIADLRAGFVNDRLYRLYQSDLGRTRIPFVVRYDLPQSYAGSEICWTGVLLLQGRDGVRDRSSTTQRCETFDREAGPTAVFGLSMNGIDLAVRITPPTRLIVWSIALRVVRVAAALLVLLACFKPHYVRLTLAAIGVAASMGVISQYHPDQHAYVYPFGETRDELSEPIDAPTFRSYRVLPSDLDGFWHVLWGRSILWNALNGHVGEALWGGEDVFEYVPGMRYLEAATLAVFGDSEFAPMFFAAFTVVCLFFFFATFADSVVALLLCVMFIAGPAVLTQPFLLDLRVWLHVYLGHWGDGDAALAFFAGLAILLRLSGGRISPMVGALVAPGLLISAAIFMRPNFAAAGLAAVLCCLWKLHQSLSRSQLALLVACFAFTGTAALHNLVFGGEFVLFTARSYLNLGASPGTWMEALGSWIGGTGSNAATTAVTRHLTTWLGDLFAEQQEWKLQHEFVLLRLASLALLPGLVLIKRLRTQENLTLLALVLASHVVLLFYLNTGRYGLLAWPCTFLAAVLVLRELSLKAIGLFLPNGPVYDQDRKPDALK